MSDAGMSTGKKKGGKAPAVIFTPCGKGKHCRCAICNKAREQKVRFYKTLGHCLVLFFKAASVSSSHFSVIKATPPCPGGKEEGGGGGGVLA